MSVDKGVEHCFVIQSIELLKSSWNPIRVSLVLRRVVSVSIRSKNHSIMSQMVIRLVFFSVAMLFVAAAVAHADNQSQRATNFVVFLTDDQGWGDLACYGHPRIKSPNLDEFAQQAIRFTQCYSACAVCSPSRSAILTGRTPYRNGVWRWIPDGHFSHLRSSEITIAELLNERGYETCHVGKWHLNGHFNKPSQPQPNDHGYDYWLATQNNARPNHKNPKNFVRNGQAVGPMEGYSAVLVVEEAIRWLNERPGPEKPFFLTVWTHEPHAPIESASRFMQPYADIEDEGIRQHHGNITQLDHAFGMLMKALDELDHTSDTFVFYTSDNGPEGDGTRGRERGSTGGLRGRKRDTYEGGIRVPGMVRWPGKTKAGTTSNEPIIGSDVFATLCDIAEIPLPDDRTIDGASITPVFSNKSIQRSEPLYWRNHLAPAMSRVGLRLGDWKIVASDDMTHFELYNLRDDPQEQTELSARQPEKFAELKRAIIQQDKEVLEEGPGWWNRDGKRE